MMKKLLILAVIAVVGLSASAQFANSSSSSAYDNKGWSTIYAEWNPMSMYYTGKGDVDDVNFNAFSLGFNRAFALSQSTPIYLETGLAAQFMFRSDTEEEGGTYWWKETLRTQMLSLKAPVNFLYKWNIPNSSVELMPFLGLSLRANIWGQQKEIEEGYDPGEPNNQYSGSESWSLFDKKEMEEGQWKRFQIGWQVGVKARFNEKFIIGGSFGTDFMDIVKKNKFRTGTILVGYTF